MASETPKSPFEFLPQILPQGHDKALKQAFFNTGANLFVLLVVLAAIAVYHILEAFLRPLLWAILCGTFLFPFKNILTTFVSGWLQGLRTTDTPLIVGAALLPLKIVDKASERLLSAVLNNIKLLAGIALGIPAVYLLYNFGPLGLFASLLICMIRIAYEVLGYFSAPLVWSVTAAYVLVVIFFWTPETSMVLRPLSIPVWLAWVFHLASITGPLKIPLLVLALLLMLVGFISEVTAAHCKKSTEGETSPTKASAIAARTVWSGQNTVGGIDNGGESTAEQPPEPPVLKTPEREAEKARAEVRQTETLGSATEKERPQQLKVDLKHKEKDDDKAKKQPLSNRYFIALFWALVFVRLWKSIWIVIQVLPILVAFWIIKKLGVHLSSWQFIQDKLTAITQLMNEQSDSNRRLDLLLPKPLRGLAKLALRGDKKIVHSLEQSMNNVVTILIVVSLLLGLILFTVFAAIQVHKESMHLVSVSSNVLNNTLHPEFSQWLPDQEYMQETLDTMVGNAYVYGREWIASKIQTMLNVDDSSKENVEKQVLQIWDKIYRTWLARNTTAHLVRQDSVMDLNNISSVMDLFRDYQDFSLNIIGLLKENLGMFLSVLDSVWAVLKGNISLCMNIVTATLSLLLGGGTAVLNFVISLVIFMTTLFYLLAFSGDQYKPVEWFVSFSPGQTGSRSNFGSAVEEAIGSVFLASLKMASFYGLYTWLTHSLFGIQIVFIPSALASIFAAIPFLGTYWAALPAVVELWLVKGQGLQALLLFICHLLPAYVVDTAIYSEIKGGHPYLTGLAIAGGMYWMGLEGAILAPILLCCLIVVMNVYQTMMAPDSSDETVRHPRVATLMAGKTVHFKRDELEKEHRGISQPADTP